MPFMRMGVRLILLMLVLAPAAPLSAQQWSVSAQAGRMRSALDPAEALSTLAFGIGYDAPAAGLRISTGVPTSAMESLWVGASAWKRVAFQRRGFVAGVDLAGNAFMTRDRTTAQPRRIPGPFNPPLDEVSDQSGHAYAGQVLPVLGYEGSSFIRIHARAGVSSYAAQFGQQRTDRSVRLAEVQLTLTPASSLAILPVVRRFDAGADAIATYGGVAAVAAAGRVSVWGSFGHWMDVSSADPAWTAGARLRLHPRTSIEAGVRRDTFDPLYLQPAQTAWNLGLSIQVGGPVVPVKAPAAPVPAAYQEGRATIRLSSGVSGGTPRIAGDFNDWVPSPMVRSGGHWTITLPLAPGVYNYAFVSADGTWFVPEGHPGRRDDGMGGHVAILVVE